MLSGYVCVSTQDQDTDAQIASLKSSGCELIFQENASGGRWDRPELHRLLGGLYVIRVTSKYLSEFPAHHLVVPSKN